MLTGNPILTTWILGLLITATVCGMWIVVRQWRRGRLVIDHRQLWLRLAGGLALLGIWTVLGALLLYVDPHAQLDVALACFYAVVLLSLLLVVLAWLDMRLVRLHRLRHETRLAADFARLWSDSSPRPAAPSSPAHGS